MLADEPGLGTGVLAVYGAPMLNRLPARLLPLCGLAIATGAVASAAVAAPAHAASAYRACGATSNAEVGRHGLAAWGSIKVRGGATCRTGVRIVGPLQKRMGASASPSQWPTSVTVRGYRCRYLGGTNAEDGGDGSAEYRCSQGRRHVRVLMVF